MKYFVLFVLIFVSFICFAKSTLLEALSDVINVLFIQKQIYFNIIVYGSTTPSLMHTLNEVSQIFQSNFTSTTITRVNFSNWNHQIDESAVIFASHFKDLQNIMQFVKLSNKYQQNLQFLVYCEEMPENGTIKIPPKLKMQEGEFSSIAYIFMQLYFSYGLMTYEWFSEKNCNHPDLKMLNTYSKEFNLWEKKLVIKKKFRNFYGCKLILCTDIILPQNDGTVLSPIGNVFKELGKKANFKPYYQGGPRDASCDAVWILNQRAISIKTHSTVGFLPHGLGMIATPHKPYTVMDKLIMPFDETTWILLFVVFLYAFLCIVFINLVSRKLKDIIFGKGVTTPTFNIIAIWFGIGQTTLPDSNFARILLTTFIWFCLIFRTAYQSLLFEYMSQDMRKSPPETIDDLFVNNYKVFAVQSNYDQFVDMIPSERRPNIVLLNQSYYYKLFADTSDQAGENYAILIYHDLDRVKFITKNFPNKCLKEYLFTKVEGYKTAANHFLLDLFNEVLQDMISNGIIQYLHNEYKNSLVLYYSKLKLKEEQLSDEKEPIQFEELEYGFELWFGACFICYLVFLMELSVFHLRLNPFYGIKKWIMQNLIKKQ